MSTTYFEIGGISYRWEGGFGCAFKSHERGVKPGDCRFIQWELFYAFSIYRGNFWEKDTVNWVPVREVNSEDLRNIKRKLVGE